MNRQPCQGPKNAQPICCSCMERMRGQDDLAECEYLYSDAPVVELLEAFDDARAELDRAEIEAFLRRDDKRRGVV